MDWTPPPPPPLSEFNKSGELNSPPHTHSWFKIRSKPEGTEFLVAVELEVAELVVVVDLAVLAVAVGLQ